MGVGFGRAAVALVSSVLVGAGLVRRWFRRPAVAVISLVLVCSRQVLVAVVSLALVFVSRLVSSLAVARKRGEKIGGEKSRAEK